MRTRLTELLGLKYPIIQPGMANVADSRLVAAVCNAGGLGFLSTAHLTTEEYRQEIRKIKELVGNKPFGCTMSPLMPGAKRYLDIWIEEKVPVWGSALRDPFRALGVKKPKGVIYIPTVGDPRQGKKLEELGLADAIIAHCMEGGGHPGRIAGTVFIPKMAEMVKIPVIAAGGHCDGKGLAAALAMGAEGIAMGTRFALTQESRLPDKVKKRYLAAQFDVPKFSNIYDGIFCNVIEGDKRKNYRGWWTHPWDVLPSVLYHKNSIGASWREMMAQAGSMRKMQVNPIQMAVGMKLFEQGLVGGDTEKGLMWAGQVVGRVKDIPTCSELMERTVLEAEEIIRTMAQRFVASK